MHKRARYAVLPIREGRPSPLEQVQVTPGVRDGSDTIEQLITTLQASEAEPTPTTSNPET